MTNSKYLHLVFDNFINDNIGPLRKHQLAGGRRQAYTPTIWKLTQCGYARENSLGNTLSGRGIVFANALDNASEVGCGISRPTDAYHARNICSMRSTTSSCSSRSPRRAE